MHRYFLQLSYKGTNYHGWQVQPNAVTVQGELNKAFSTILREGINIIGCGRTDTGVHARNFVAHLDLAAPVSDLSGLNHKLNRFLPPDIVIHAIVPVDGDLHSRFSATARTYHYFIIKEKDPFELDFAYRYHHELDIKKMNEACQILLNYEDFTSFSKLHSDTAHNLCTVYEASWLQQGHKLQFTIRANRFLRNMVRAIVGTMLDIGRGQVSLDDFHTIIQDKKRSSAGQSVPPQGLFLVSVEYPVLIFP